MADVESALRNGLAALIILREINDTFNLVYVLRHLGDLRQQLGDETVAYQLWEEALEIAKFQQHPLLTTLNERLAKE